MRRPMTADKLRALMRESNTPASREMSFEEAADSVKPRNLKRRRGASDLRKSLARHIADAEARIARRHEGERAWDGADARTLVGLYALSHRHVYGVDAQELEKEFLAATSSARALLRKEFGDAVVAAVHFVQWCWARENKAERVRRAEGKTDGRRLGWRLQFAHRSLLVDYRTASARRR